MINTKLCRNKLLEILNQISAKMDKSNRVLVQKNLNSLKAYIENEYNYDAELPKISHRLLSEIIDDIEDIDLLLGNVFVSESFDMPEDVKNEEKQLVDFARSLINKYDLTKKEFNSDVKSDIYPMIDFSSNNYGKGRVVEALKSGIDIFWKQKKDIFPQNIKLTDENWLAILELIQNNYPIQTIEKYLSKGLISNLVFETKNSKNINTSKLVDTILKLKKEGKYE